VKTKSAIKWAGSKAALARVVGVSPQAVSNWPEIVPFDRQGYLEKTSNGKLRALKRRPKRAARVAKRQICA